MANVGWMHGQLADLLLDYEKIRDCILGSRAIKKKGVAYLPMPSPVDQSPQNLARYEQYKQRAVFYNVTDRTLKGMTGQVFLRDPVVEIPNELDAMEEDSDGTGVTLMQLAQRAVSSTISFGRCGLLVDFPTIVTDANNQNAQALDNPMLSRAQIDKSDIHPTITHYYPWNIINWQTEVVGAKRILTLVVLEEKRMAPADDFAVVESVQYRVLRLDADGEHYVEIWQKDMQSAQEQQTIAEPTLTTKTASENKKPIHGDKRKDGEHTITTFVPTNNLGAKLQSIPFMFVGSETNDTNLDKPPLIDLSVLNIAHFCNSADYEESSFLVGQPTLFVTGLTEQWLKNELGGVIALGSRGGLPLPVGSTAGLLQVQPNILPAEAMKMKEEQMVAIGAKLVQNTHTQRTATEVIVETTSESSVLSQIAKNVSSAFEWCLSIAADFAGAAQSTITYTLNQDYDLTSMSAADRAELVKEWQSGAIAFPEMRAGLRKAGIATMDDDEAQAAIQAELALMPQPMQLGPPGGDPNAEGKPIGQGGSPGASGAPSTGA